MLRNSCNMDKSATDSYVAVHQRDGSYVTVEVIRQSGAKPIVLRRSRTENLGACLARLGLKLFGREAASNTTLALVATTSIESSSEEGTEVLGSTPNALAWASAQYLRAGDELLPIVVNRPEVLNLWCINAPMEGYPLKPTAELHHASDEHDLNTIVWSWTRAPVAFSGTPPGNLGEVEVCSSRSYTPTNDDVGSILTVRALPPAKPNSPPGSGAPAVSHTLIEPVAARADPSSGLSLFATPAMQARHQAFGPNPFMRVSSKDTGGIVGREDVNSNSSGAPTVTIDPSGLRVLSLNLLADAYRRTWDDSVHLYRSADLTSMDRRAPVLLSDVLGFDPDVACLQEVDAAWFEKWWVPQLRDAGYEGNFAAKQGNAKEGVALFWKTSRLRLRRLRGQDEEEDTPSVATEALSYGSYAYAKLPEEVSAYVESRPWMVDTLKRVTSVAQIGTFDLVREADGGDDVDSSAASANNEPTHSTARRSITVVNTHLFFANGAPHVRVLQAAMALEVAREQHQCGLRRDGGKSCNENRGLVFCGDLNADPKSGCLRFLQEGILDPSDESWRRGESFRWGDQSASTQDERNAKSRGSAGILAAAAESNSDPEEPSGGSPLPLPPPVLRHPFALQSSHDPATQLAAVDLKDTSSRWSNLGCSHATLGYRATLDWILVGGFSDEGALKVERCAPLPTKANDGREPDAPLPDSAFPGSDHLAVCADLVWRHEP